MTLTAERLREVLDCDPATGVFRWKARPVREQFKRTDRAWNTRSVGKIAGCVSTPGYRFICIDGKHHGAHRLVWFYVHGEFPLLGLDHIDTCKDHNWIGNLRPANQSQNQANRGIPRNNKSGFKGVHLFSRTGKWHAQLRGRFLGAFSTPEEAHKVYAAAALGHYGEFARLA